MITINLVMAITVGVLYGTGFTLLLSRSLMRVLIGVVVLGHGTNLLLQLAGGPPGRAPIVGNSSPETFSDPVPQALALTAIVITFALTTFLLALDYRSYVLLGHDEVQDDVEDRRIARQKAPTAPLEGGDGGEDEETLARADDEVEAAATGEAGSAGRDGAGAP